MSWPISALGDHCEILSGFAFKSSQFNTEGEGLPLIRIRDVVPGKSETYYSGEYEDRFLVTEGDLLIGMDGDFNRARWQSEPALLNQRVCKVSAKGDLNQGYLYHLLPSVLQVISDRTPFVTVKHLSAKDLKEFEVPLPPLEEQKRIAGILDQADALRRLRARALEKLNTLGQAVFQEMFGGANSVKTQPLRDIIDVRSSLDDPKKDENKTLLHVGPEHITPHAGRIEWQNVRTCEEDGVISGKYRFTASDILFSKIRPYLNKVAITDREGMCSADMYAIVANQNLATQQYIKFVLSSQNFLAYASTVSNRANIPKINRDQLLAFECPLPPISAQMAFQEKISRIEQEGCLQQGALACADNLFASLQSAAFQGKL